MSQWIVTGASGSIAKACISRLLSKNKSVLAISRSEFNYEDQKVSHLRVNSYDEIQYDTSNCEGLLVTQGFFHFEKFETILDDTRAKLIEANFLSQIIVVQSFLKQIIKQQRVNVVVLGSTSAFESGEGTVLYGAAKAGMLALVRALNNEYVGTDIRFTFASTGTINNEMGRKVPNQDPSSLLDVNEVANQIVDTVTNESNLWQPEITIRRRHIKRII